MRLRVFAFGSVATLFGALPWVACISEDPGAQPARGTLGGLCEVNGLCTQSPGLVCNPTAQDGGRCEKMSEAGAEASAPDTGAAIDAGPDCSGPRGARDATVGVVTCGAGQCVTYEVGDSSTTNNTCCLSGTDAGCMETAKCTGQLSYACETAGNCPGSTPHCCMATALATGKESGSVAACPLVREYAFAQTICKTTSCGTQVELCKVGDGKACGDKPAKCRVAKVGSAVTGVCDP